jgi:hypothetical protein
VNQFTLGQHEANIRALMEGMEQVQGDLAEIKELLAERRGERRVAFWLAGGAGAIGSAVLALVKLVVAGLHHS